MMAGPDLPDAYYPPNRRRAGLAALAALVGFSGDFEQRRPAWADDPRNPDRKRRDKKARANRRREKRRHRNRR